MKSKEKKSNERRKKLCEINCHVLAENMYQAEDNLTSINFHWSSQCNMPLHCNWTSAVLITRCLTRTYKYYDIFKWKIHCKIKTNEYINVNAFIFFDILSYDYYGFIVEFVLLRFFLLLIYTILCQVFWLCFYIAVYDFSACHSISSFI